MTESISNRLKKTFYGLMLIALTSLLVKTSSAAQLINSLPVSLVENWSVCIYFENQPPECIEQKTPELDNDISEPVTNFIYQKEFILSSQLQQHTVALWLDTVDDADEIRINGQLIGKTGHFPPHFQSGFRYQRLYLIPANILKYNQFNHLEIKTFSSINRPGLGNHPVIIADYFSLAHSQQEHDYIYIACISILLLLTSFQLFYYFMVKGNDETIYLSVFLLSFAMISFTRSQAPLHMSLDLSSVYKIEIFMISTGMVAFTLYLFRFFNLELRKIYILGSGAIAIPGLIGILYPDPLATRNIADVGYWIIVFAAFFIAGSALIIALKKSQRYSLIYTSVCGMSWLILFYDAISQSPSFASMELELEPSLLPITSVFVGICMTFTITHKYWQIFKGATYHHLTGTLLQPAFFQRLSDELQQNQKDNTLLMIAMIHIREFKHIGENYGQAIQNNMLTVVSDVICKRLRAIDLICYFSGEEFCIAVSVESRKEAEEKMKEIHKALVNTKQVLNKDTELLISAHLGGVIYNPDQHLSISQLLQDAGYALEKSKTENSADYLLINNPTVTA